MLAIIALIALIPTVVTALSLRAQVSELSDEVRSLKDRVVVGEIKREFLQEEVSTDVEAVREDVAERFRDILDASAVVERIDDAVFTISSEHGQGTGFGIRSSGSETWIATNYHVVEGSIRGGRVTVRSGYASWQGTVERWDRYLDVALVKVDDSMPVLVSAYDAGHPPAVGDAVLAYGSPYGLEGPRRSGSSRPSARASIASRPISRPTHRSIPETPEARSSTRTATFSASRPRRPRGAASGSPSTSESCAPSCSRGTAATEGRSPDHR
jgi:S1-C subfamily serine protease